MEKKIRRLKGKQLVFQVQKPEFYAELLSTIANTMASAFRFNVSAQNLEDYRASLDPIYETILMHIRIYDDAVKPKIPSVPTGVATKHLSGLNMEVDPVNAFAIISVTVTYPGMIAEGKSEYTRVVQKFNLVFKRPSNQTLGMDWYCQKMKANPDLAEIELNKFIIKL